jgi:nicotinamidase-related amidase
MLMLHRDTTALLVIDVQEKLLPAIHGADGVAAKAVILIKAARILGIPVLWAEQYPKGLGPTVESLATALDGLKPIDKVAFSCLREPAFSEALGESGRRKLLMTGIETHVCVQQTALDALNQGYEAFVCRDATGSRAPIEHDAALARMAAKGVDLVTVESALFELLGEARTPEFKEILPLIR